MAVMKKPDTRLVEQYSELVSTFDNLVHKKMFGCPCSFINGNMFAGVVEDYIFLRTGQRMRDEILGKYPGSTFAPRGRIMKEYITIPAAILGDRPTLLELINRAYLETSALPPKIKKG